MPEHEWKPETIDPVGLRRQIRNEPAELRKAIEALIDKARVDIPADYDIQTAFADVLSLGAFDAPPEIRPAILRLSIWLFDRLPKTEAGPE